MMLRVSLFSATLVASLVLAVRPASAQSYGSGFSDTATQASPYHGTVVEDIVADVNDQVISKSDYDRAQDELEQEARQQGWSQQELYQQRRDLLRSLIDKQLLLSKGKELGITGETQLVKRLDDMRKQYHLDSMEDLQKAAEAQGVSFEDLKEQIRENIITSEVIGQEVGSHIQVSPSEIQDYYNTHHQEFEHPEEVRLSEILVPTPNPDDAAQVADAEKKADGIEARLKAGADFATIAKADSGGSTAAEGGDLGEYKHGQLAPVLEQATFGLKAHQFTEPIRTRQGWLILEVTDHQNAGLAPLSEVENQIQEEVGYTKMEPALRDYLTTLREQGFVEVRPGYTDSGATPNEIKLLQSAYTPPQPRHKHKKREERTRFREKSPRKPRQTQNETAGSGVPAGVPTLDQVNHGHAGEEVASASGTQKPGKKEKIRFGQAPRETLPSGPTRSVDAGAQQVASNGPDTTVALTNSAGDVINSGDTSEKRTKTRFSDRARESKAQRAREKAASKRKKFVPPVETPEQVAADKLQDAALGLNGDTSKQKKANAAKSGPKRRFGDEDQKDEDKKKEQTPAPSSGSGSVPASNGAGTPAPAGVPTSPSPQ